MELRKLLTGALLPAALLATTATAAGDPKNPPQPFARSAAQAKPEPAPVVIVQDYAPSPAIWKLSDEDTTIYMFGTIHLLPEGFRWRSPEFDRIVADVDELVVETSDADGEEQIAAMMEPLFANIDERRPISARLSPENVEKWHSFASLVGMPVETFDRLPVFIAMVGIAMTMIEEMGSESDYGVETVLEAEFAASGRPIGSIERGDEVMAALLAIDEELMIGELDRELSAWDGAAVDEFLGAEMEMLAGEAAPEDDFFATEHAWAQGQPIEDDWGDSPADRAVYKVLLTDRNRAWAEWLDTRLDAPGAVLLAAGAAHFEGPDSVLVMLEERGLEAERLD